MAGKNTVSLVFLGDEKKLTQAMDKVGLSTKTLTGDISKTSAQSVAALDKVGQATDNLSGDVGKSADKSSGALDKVGQAAAKMSGDLGKSASQAAGKLGEVDKAGQAIKDPNMKITISSPGTSEIDKIAKAGESIKPVKVPITPEVDTGKAKESIGKFKDIGAQGADMFGAGFLGGIASGGFASSLASIAGDAFKQSQANNKLNIDMQNQMGLSPEDAKKYGDRIGSMYAQGLGESKGQIAAAYSTLSSDVKNWSDLNASEQDRVVGYAVKVSQAFGADMPEAIKAATTAVSSGLVPSYKDAFDMISTGLGTLGSKGDDYLATLGEYSPYFQKIGFSGAQALGLIQQMTKAGARDTDYAADAWKEFGIRIIDAANPTTIDALKSLGLNAKKIPEVIAAGGPAAEMAVEGIVKKLQGLKDPVEKNRIGVELFGTQWEDTMRNVIDKIDPAAAKMTALSGATDKLVSNTASQTDILGRRWERGLGIAGDHLATFTNKLLDATDKMPGLVDAFSSGGLWAENMGGKVKGTSDAIRIFQDIANVGAKMKVELEDRAMAGLQSVEDKLKGLPPKKAITVQSLSAEAVADLESVGYKVTNLPNGQFRVQAQTGDAYSRLGGLLSDYGNRNLQWTVSVKQYVQTIGMGMFGHADGGWIHGPGTGRSDSIPLMASNGEFMVQEKYARPNAALLEAINSGQSWSPSMASPSGYSSGGSSGGGGGGAWRVAGNADSAVGTMIQTLLNNGVIQLT